MDDSGATVKKETHPGSMRSYTIGFMLSLVLTILPYLIVVEGMLSGWMLIAALSGFAVAQLLIQLIFFLHLGRGPGARWNLIAFLFMLLVVFILVAGSLWIMNNLDYNMMPAEKMDEYMLHQSQKGF